MKKFLYTCLGLSLLLGACSESDDSAPQATIQLSSKSEQVNIASDGLSGTVHFEATGGSAQIAVATNQKAWTVTKTAEWCNAVQSGNQLTVSVDPNASTSEQEATITLNAGNVGNQAVATLKVKQLGKDQASLTLSSQSPLVQITGDTGRVAFAVEGGEAEISVATNQTEWSYQTEGGDWCNVKKENNKLTISAVKNPTTQDQAATITLKAGDAGNMATVVLSVTQQPQAIVTLEVTPTSVVLAPKGSSQEVTVTTNQASWDAVTTDNWLTVEKAEGKFTVKAEANQTGSPRSGSVAVKAGEGQNVADKTVTVTQESVDNRMILLVKPTAAKFSLQLDGYVDVKVSWGDGTPVETFTEVTFPSHTYEDITKEYEVTISGVATKLNANNATKFPAAAKKSILAVKQWGNIGLTEMRGAFYQCSNLTDLAADTGDAFAEVNTMMQAFYQCTLLKAIPEGFLDNCPNITTFQYAFQDCKALEALPAGLFLKTPKATSFASTFSGCSALKAIPAGLFDAITAEGVTFATCFGTCTALTEIPEDLFAKCVNATTFSSVFEGCKGITAIPAGLFRNNSKVTFMASVFASTGITSIPAELFDAITAPSVNMSNCFKNCKSLTAIPVGIFEKCVNVVNFTGIFEGCSLIQSIPTGLFDKCPDATIFQNAFASCPLITAIPEGLFDKHTKAFNFNNCFSGCTGLQSIPAELFSKCTELKMVSAAFLNCTSLTSIPAGLFDNNRILYNVGTCFSGCTGLTGESPYTTITVDGNPVKVHLYERSNYSGEFTPVTSFTDCFKGCTGLSDYGLISSSYAVWI